jgi:hypothetical protein
MRYSLRQFVAAVSDLALGQSVFSTHSNIGAGKSPRANASPAAVLAQPLEVFPLRP